MNEQKEDICQVLVQELYELFVKDKILKINVEPTERQRSSQLEIKSWLQSRNGKINMAQRQTLSELRVEYKIAKPGVERMPLENAEAAIRQAYGKMRRDSSKIYQKTLGELRND